MKKRRKNIEIDIKKEIFIIVLVFLFISLFFLIKPKYIGFVVYQPNTYNWTFDNPNDYIYDSSLINISNGIITLMPTITIEFWNITNEIGYNVEQAVYDGVDDTNKIIALDGTGIIINKLNIFDVTFSNNINNGDVINLYLTQDPSTQASNIYLCDANTICTYPGYGSIYYDNTNGWFSIKVIGLNTPVNKLNIDPDIVNFDYINATHIEIIENNSTNIIYPLSASIETNDINIATKYVIFNSDHKDNITYKYSTDSGVNWLNVPENNNISLENKTKLRFRANLLSDTLSTPILYDFSISYLSETCEELWTCAEWSSCSQDTKTRTRVCIDNNLCGTTVNKPLEVESCFPNYYELNEGSLLSIEANRITTINKTDIILDILTNENVSGINLSIISYKTHNSIQPSKSLKFLDINADQALINSLNSTKIKMYYTDEELDNLNLEESSLKIYYYNENTSTWEALDSIINIEENYLEVNLVHFSTYGIFGNERETTKTASSSGDGERTESKESKELEEQEVKPKVEEIQTTEESIRSEETKEEIEIKDTTTPQITGEVIREVNNENTSIIITSILLIIILIIFIFFKFKK